MNPLFSRIGWRVALDIFNRGSFLIVTIFLARTLSVTDFGRYGYALSFVHIFYTFTDLGTHIMVLKELGEEKKNQLTHWVTFLNLKLVLMLATALLFGLIVAFFPVGSPALLAGALVWMFGNSLLDFGQFVCNGLQRMALARWLILIQRFLVIGGVILAMIWTGQLPLVVMVMGLCSLLGSTLGMVLIFRKLNIPFVFRPHLSDWISVLKRSYPNAFSMTFGTWTLRLSMIFVGWFTVGEALGQYNAAFRIYELSYILPASIMAIGVPHLSSALTEGKIGFTKELKKMGVLMFGLAFVGGGVLYGASGPLVHFAFGEKYAMAHEILKLMALVSVLLVLNQLSNYLMIIFNRQVRHAWHEGVVLAASILCYLVLVPKYGGLGAAATLLMSQVLLLSLTLIYLLRKIEVPYDGLKNA